MEKTEEMNNAGTDRALSREEHALLSEVGAGTSMGRLLRQYWVPALLSEELPGPDCPPVRVGLMGENLVAFRDSHGRVGLLREFCCHRGASLYLARNEEAGLRCAYHGWKFDIQGRLLDVPNSRDPTLLVNVRQPAYTCRELGGVVLAYLGTGEEAPPVPDLEWFLVPDNQRYVSKRLLQCHWLQALELDIDSSHVPWLHREALLHTAGVSETSRLMLEQTAPTFEIVQKEYGLLIAARRDVHPDRYYWRINQWLVPWYTFVPDDGMAGRFAVHAWVPLDDRSSWVYSFTWDTSRPLSERELSAFRSGTQGIYCQLNPGSYVPRRNRSNDWGLDRAAQSRGELWTGIAGNQDQDNAIAESMGPSYDRTLEHLVEGDAAVVATRRRLLAAARDLEFGQAALGIRGRGFRVHPVSTILPREVNWEDATRDKIEVTRGVGA
jgi:phenylpropionate dioxygenase-like ring-hydroxylating dioxygenase large terminal subunit